MILKQFYLNCLAHASYLVGDEESGVAAVDPQRDIGTWHLPESTISASLTSSCMPISSPAI